MASEVEEDGNWASKEKSEITLLCSLGILSLEGERLVGFKGRRVLSGS